MVTPPREAKKTVAFIDQYCWLYRSLFKDVRHYESFKYLHVGMLSEIKRKSLPSIARAVGLKDRGQSLHHFLKDAPWKVEEIQETRLWLTKLLIGEREVVLLIDETGDEKKGKIQLQVGGLYSLRNWIEYGFKQIKDELGWADFRVTDYASIEKWWEIVMSAYLLVSLQANYFQLETVCRLKNQSDAPSTSQLSHHPLWEAGTSWKGALNNLRLIIQPYTFYNLLQPWLEVFTIPKFRRCFLELIEQMNQFFGLSSFDFSLFPFMAA